MHTEEAKQSIPLPLPDFVMKRRQSLYFVVSLYHVHLKIYSFTFNYFLQQLRVINAVIKRNLSNLVKICENR